MNYEESVAYISSLQGRGWRLGLDRMEEFARQLRLAGSLGDGVAPRFIHVAGTNGKGSTTAFVQSLLISAGYKTGGYFSPYVYDFRERVQLNGKKIRKERLASVASELRPVADAMTETEFGGITEFEFKTALGFQYWKEESCDWVACEVGLGGRLDATNILSPAASIITSIGLDHVHILGHTLEEIAREKAGIIKLGVPVVVGMMDAPALSVIEEIARQREAPIWKYGKDFDVIDEGGDSFGICSPNREIHGLKASLRGGIQRHNAALAVAACEAAGLILSDDQIRAGIRSAYAPGRFEVVEYGGRTCILDGAHNGHAANVLAAEIRNEFPGCKVVLLTNMIDGHDPGEVFQHLEPLVKSVHVAPIDFFRATEPSVMAEKLRHNFACVMAHGDLRSALESAVSDCSDGDVLLVTGSFYLVGDVGRAIGLGSADEADSSGV